MTSAATDSAKPDSSGEDNVSHCETVVEARSSWLALDLREFYGFRDLLVLLAWRDVQVRYKQTVLGAAWAVLQPVAMMFLFALTFGRLVADSTGDVPYSLFVYAGLLPWMLFATALSSAANSVVGSERLVTKIYFPRLMLPLAAVAPALIDFLVAAAVLAVLLAWHGIWPGWGLVAMPLPIFLLIGAALGMGSALAALNVAYRDFRYVIPFLLQIWLFATPTIYLGSAAIAKAEGASWQRRLLALNPLTNVIDFFRAAALGEPLPWKEVSLSALMIGALLVAGGLYFRRAEDQFADII